MTTEITAPDASKKEALLEIFRAAVWGELVPGGRKDLQNAVKTAKKGGVTDSDLEWLSKLDGKKFRDYFGEKALTKDLENAMKVADGYMEGMRYTPQFKAAGFYKAKP